MFHPPGGLGVRWDYTFMPATPFANYDSMIGKLITYGESRDVIARMRHALEELVVDGIKTNIPLQQKIMADELCCWWD